MEFLVINGSPKSELSVTQQYVRYLEQRYPEHRFVRFQVARRLKALERDPAELEALMDQMRSADAVLWACPVYYLLVPAQLKRLIELLFEADTEQHLAGVTATSLTTSIHFFDHTAHEYMQAVCEDLGMRAVPGLSCGMNDLLKPAFGDSLAAWFADFARIAADRAPVAKRFAPVRGSAFRYRPGRIAPAQPTGKRIVMVSDSGEHDQNLQAMERVLAAELGGQVERITLEGLGLKGGCLGCLRCGWDGECVYRDGFQETFRERILTADALIFSGAVRDRYLSARFKQFFDRSFFLGHRPELGGKPLVWLVSGPLGQLATLRHVLESFAEVSRIHLVEVVTDEVRKSAELTALLRETAHRLRAALERPVRRPRKFPAVAGTKLFRDFVWLATAVFPADDRFYRAHGIYDFPQKQVGRRLVDRALYWAMHLPPLRKRVQRDMRRLMLRPYEKIVGPVDRSD